MSDRRSFLRGLLALPALPALGRAKAPAPPCDGGGPTLHEIAGPSFKPDSPPRTSLLEPGLAGTPIVLSGVVRATSCRIVPGTLLDFWNADPDGVYDQRGYRLRGHQVTAADGRYQLETVLPGPYANRSRHIHVKVRPPGGAAFATQLFFPGEARNASDPFYRRPLELRPVPGAGPGHFQFDFVVRG